MAHLSYFLGANSPGGFYSLYHQLPAPEEGGTVYILKGGPGCGKSTLMKGVGEAAQAAGLTPEYIWCSGDPDSLDALILPSRRSAIVDGTAPHVVEPRCPGAAERYVDLGRFWECGALSPLRGDILRAMAEGEAPRRRARRCLAAAAQLRADCRELLLTPLLGEKLRRRARAMAGRELKGAGGGGGEVRQRFLSALTHRGPVCLWETAELQCSRIWVLSDRFGLAHEVLSFLLAAAAAGSHDAVACPDPLEPQRLAHLLLPGLSLAFLSSTPALPCPLRPARRVRLEAMGEEEVLARCKGRLRFSQRVVEALLAEAAAALGQAKEAHDRLEALYRPHVDFRGVERTGEALAQALLSP